MKNFLIAVFGLKKRKLAILQKSIHYRGTSWEYFQYLAMDADQGRYYQHFAIDPCYATNEVLMVNWWDGWRKL